MDSVVDAFFTKVRMNMEVDLAEWIIHGIDPVNRRYINVTKTIPDTFQGVIERTINRIDTFDGLCKDEIEKIKLIFQFGIPIGILLNVDDLAEYDDLEICEDVAIRIVDACMSRVRAGSIHEQMRQKILKQDHAVRVIQRCWRFANSCPEYKVCRSRLVREISEMDID